MFEDDEKTTRTFENMTSNALISGMEEDKDKQQINLIRNRIMLIPEMAEILSSHTENKAQLFALFRNIYDGTAGKNTGTGVNHRFDNLNVTMIAGAAPVAFDNQVMIHNDLGTREFYYRMDDKSNKVLLKRITKNTEDLFFQDKKNRLKGLLRGFIDSKEYQNIEINDEVLDRIYEWALITSKLRATANIDYAIGIVTGKQ